MARGGEALRSPTITTTPVTAEAVDEWLRSAHAGDVLVYFTGPMALQTVPAVGAARSLQERGLVCLFQQRRGPALFDYCMKKRARAEKPPLSRAEIESHMAEDVADLLKVLKSLARNGEECPSNAALADLAELKDAESARYRLGLLAISGHIEIATPPQGPRVITLVALGKSTSAGVRH